MSTTSRLVEFAVNGNGGSAWIEAIPAHRIPQSLLDHMGTRIGTVLGSAADIRRREVLSKARATSLAEGWQPPRTAPLKLTTENYRGLRDHQDIALPRLSVIVGRNNAGKSSLLEAATLAVDYRAFSYIIDRRLVNDVGHGLRAMFMRRDDSMRLRFNDSFLAMQLRGGAAQCVAGQSTSGLEYVDALPYQQDSARLGCYRSDTVQHIDVDRRVAAQELERAVSLVELRGEMDRLLGLLGSMLPGIRDLRVVMAPNSGPYLYVKDANGAIWPAIAGGDGFRRLLLLATLLNDSSRLAITAIEDPDAFAHPGVLDQIARLLCTVSESGSNIVITTHSQGFIQSIQRCLEENLVSADQVSFFVMNEGRVSAQISGAESESRQPEMLRSIGLTS